MAVSRRALVLGGAGAVVLLGAGAVSLVEAGLLPGRAALARRWVGTAAAG